jgi:hypothetical protein
VAESNQVTIYDGDDPDLPMWMVFNAGSQRLIGMATGGTPGSITCMTAFQGEIAIGIGAGNGRGLTTANLIAERAYYYNTATSRKFLGNIAERNNQNGSSELPSIGSIVSIEINDVAMTVLPNAPIDAATGLPVPTIAVATDGGVSVIKDDGTVVNGSQLNSTWPARVVAFDSDQNLWTSEGTIWGGIQRIATAPFTSVDTLGSPSNSSSAWGYDVEPDAISTFYGTNPNAPKIYTAATSSIIESNDLVSSKDNHLHVGTTLLNHIAEDTTDITNSMIAYSATNYATGWQHGDIKLATLSDTDATDVTGAELVDNGNFNNGGDWSFGGGWNFANGQAEIDTTNNDLLSQDIGMVTGKTYTVSLVMTAYTDGVLDVRLGGNATQTATGTGVHTFTGVAGGSTLQIYAFTNATLSIDDISVRLAEEDRSVNGNGLQVFGTVTKDPVATGADLVAYSYSSSSTSNYLMQPYNSNLAFGTGDFSVMFWTKAADYTPNGSGVNFVIGLDTDLGAVTNKGAISIASSTANDLRFQIYQQGYASGGRIDCIDTDTIPTNTWNCICAVRRSGVFEIWLNGKLKATNADNPTADVSNLNTDGWHILSSNQQDVNMALFRASATAPSPEQIAKIYEDEKVLFQENAQATLYGDSDAVTALAYDDDTDLLHVGTSAGRSVFQGLRRVDNTTDAVGAAISASNGLVAED